MGYSRNKNPILLAYRLSNYFQKYVTEIQKTIELFQVDLHMKTDLVSL